MAARIPPMTRYPWAHHYEKLLAGWRKLRRRAGLQMESYGEASGYPLYYLESVSAGKDAPSLFLSAGIHGDEPAPPIALQQWVARNPQISRELNLLIFPCLNPWGLVHNSRFDERGRDLNRTYQNDRVPQTAAHRKILKGRHFDAAETLHEDYDAHGVYVYEIKQQQPYWAEKLLFAATRHLPADVRAIIEGRRAAEGVIRRKVGLYYMPQRPESLHLSFYHADRAFTIETPSEYFLDDRVEALVASVQQCAELCLKLR